MDNNKYCILIKPLKTSKVNGNLVTEDYNIAQILNSLGDVSIVDQEINIQGENVQLVLKLQRFIQTEAQ